MKADNKQSFDLTSQNSQGDLLLDLELKENPPVFTRKQYIWTSSLLTVVCLLNLVVGYFDRRQSQIRSGRPVDGVLVEGALAFAVFVALPLLGFILALLAALIPFKPHNYAKKYLPFALVLTLVLEFILLALFMTG